MLSFNSPPNHFIFSANCFTDLTLPPLSSTVVDTSFSRRAKKMMKQEGVLHLKAGAFLLGFMGVKNKNSHDSHWGSCGRGGFLRCSKGWRSEGDSALESEILAFMDTSENPEVFPSKQQLIDAGRKDLAEAIVKQGGWLASGWDFNDTDYSNNLEDDLVWCMKNGKESYNKKNSSYKECDSQETVSAFSILNVSSDSASSSGRTLETAADNESGILGILNRLDKERNMTFWSGPKDTKNYDHYQNDLNNDWLDKTSNIRADVNLKVNNPASGDKVDNSSSSPHGDAFENSLKPDTWRTWSLQRAELAGKEFEAAEIPFNSIVTRVEVDKLENVAQEKGNSVSVSFSRVKENSSFEVINRSQIRSRIQHLESELSSVLLALKSNTRRTSSQKDHESTPDALLKLSDAWEFQENEIIHGQNKLRSIRAKLAVLKGKMALAIIDAQKKVDGRQKRIADAHRSLQLLRTTSIVYPNSASEVLLAGSFDGWATKRKMVKSSIDVFSLSLKLYPGKYEIKFIVDGEWRVDPLRTIVGNNGYENNLLVIT